MIYQCFVTEEHKNNLFDSEVYEPFGLEPEVNERLLENCPELVDPFVRLQLTEYACLLWYWRNGGNPNAWMGTTSHNQLKKFDTIFETKAEVSELCAEKKVVGWGRYLMQDARGNHMSLDIHTEICHPGLPAFIRDVFGRFGYSMPDAWYTTPVGFFANYWVMDEAFFKVTNRGSVNPPALAGHRAVAE
jgi:hypothetical protein